MGRNSLRLPQLLCSPNSQSTDTRHALAIAAASSSMRIDDDSRLRDLNASS